jgi:NADH:ubiquinone oxidoreductase subunit F (NADH-binding)
VNNTETLANVPPIIVNGAEWYTRMGTPQSPGLKIVCLSGHINQPGNYEVVMGTSYRDILFKEEYGGGIPGGKAFKALLPSGGSGPVITEEALDAPLTYDGLAEHGSMLGSASLIVMDETTDMVWAARKLLSFFRHESCGKCVPCRLGTKQLLDILQDLCDDNGRPGDIELLEELGQGIKAGSLCGLGQTAPNPVLSTIRYFREDYQAHLADRRCLERV